MGDTSASSSSGDTSSDSDSSSGSSSSTSTRGVSEQADIEEQSDPTKVIQDAASTVALQMSKELMLALRAKMVGASRGTEKATKSSLVVASKHGAVTALPATQVSEVTKEKSRKRGQGDPSDKVLANAARSYSKALFPDKRKQNFSSRGPLADRSDPSSQTDLIPQGREDPSAIGTDDCADKVRKIGDPRIATEIVSGCILPRDSEMVRSLPTTSLCSGSDTLTIVSLNYEREKNYRLHWMSSAERASAESKLVAKEEECRPWKAKASTLTSEARADRYNEEGKIVEERARWAVVSAVRLYKKSRAFLDTVQRRSIPAFSFGAQALKDFIDGRVPDLDYRGCNHLVDVVVPPSDEELDDDDLYERLGEILDAEDAEKGHSIEGPSGYKTPCFGSPMHQGLELSPNPLPATPGHDLSSPNLSTRDSGGTPPSDPAARDSAGDPR
ncbi:hypothetical protein NE237_027348 [Protea cynaroides]|uniref:Uncharacterized protein n=1 Tax=Protea cynaroides TaxID=273540 RepID=A0A9Q0GP65_9MAGN|nr:hypothetical protein NE237_027348 [Protea cynaroides]